MSLRDKPSSLALKVHDTLKSVTVVITCAINPDKMEMAKRELEAIIKTAMANETACHGIRVHDDPKNPQRQLIIEYWDSEEVLPDPICKVLMQTFSKRPRHFSTG